MYKLKTKLTFLGLLLMSVFSFAQTSNTILREVKVSFRKEVGYQRYFVELLNSHNQKTDYTVDSPEWSAELPVGSYQVRSRILFKDETYSDWSEWQKLEISPFKIYLQNLNYVYFFDQNNQVNLVWNKINRASYYKLEYKENELLNYTFIPNDASLANKELNLVERKVNQNMYNLENVRNARSRLKIKAYDSNNLEIASQTFNILLIRETDFIPKIIPIKNEFVREISWKTDINFKSTSVKIYYKKSKDLWEPKLTQLGVLENKIDLPLNWPGGEYRIEVAAQLSKQVYSQPDILVVKLVDGDRSILAENNYFKNQIEEESRQYHKYFNLIISKTNATYDDKDNKIKSITEGNLLNISYAKSEPLQKIYDSFHLNKYLLTNVSLIQTQNQINYLADFNYGINLNHFELYPWFFKTYLFIGLEKNSRLTSDINLQDYKMKDFYFLKYGLSQNFSYGINQHQSVGLDLSYFNLLTDLSISTLPLVNSNTIEYGVLYSFSIYNNKHRFSIGLKNKSSVFDFRSDVPSEENHLNTKGIFLNLGYVLETSL